MYLICIVKYVNGRGIAIIYPLSLSENLKFYTGAL